MMPINGNGYGNSHYWEHAAKEIAQEGDEGCKHLYQTLPKVMFKYESQPNDDFYLRFRVKCSACKIRFYNTEETLKKRFIDFYKLNEKATL